MECPLTAPMAVVCKLFQLIVLLDDFPAAKLQCGCALERRRKRKKDRHKEKEGEGKERERDARGNEKCKTLIQNRMNSK